MRVKILAAAPFAALLMSTASIAVAADAPAADGAALFKSKTCFTCHGEDGKKTLLPDYPKIAGQNKVYAEKQMRDIKSGERANGNSAAMKGVMGLVSDEEIPILADYISKLQP